MVLKSIQAGRDDLEAINSLMRRSKAYWGYDEAFMSKFMQLFQMTSDYLEKDQVRLFYEADGSQYGMSIGFYSFSLNAESDYELDNFFIDPGYIGKGFGKKMWHHVVDDLKVCGTKKFVLWSDPGAEDFYKKMGCTKIGVKESFMMPDRYPVIFEYTI